jgi:eukaryotic-like serine/threonine-protein kinase
VAEQPGSTRRVAHRPVRTLGRYVLYDRIASGGMAAVHLGRLVGPAGFARTVAIKHLHPALGEDRDAVAMLLNEARIAARLHHPNVAATLDVVVERDGAYLIMEYVHGESLGRLRAAAKHRAPLPTRVTSSILSGALRGLHAAHEARNEHGEPLEIIHRDVSPQNILVGADGVTRLIDFGIAKARLHAQTTADGCLKGKLSYLAPEQMRGERATRRTDVYSAGVVLWETLTGRRLFDGDSAGAITEQILVGWVDPPSKYVPELSQDLDSVVVRALETDPARRFATAEEMADALERAESPASVAEVGAWVRETAGEVLEEREDLLRAIDASQPSTGRHSRLARRAAVVGLPLLLASATAVGLHARTPVGAAASTSSLPRPESSTVRRDQAVMPQPKIVTEPAAAPAKQRTANAARQPALAGSVSQRKARPAAMGRSRTDTCATPYNVNSDGIRIYKRHCLRK